MQLQKPRDVFSTTTPCTQQAFLNKFESLNTTLIAEVINTIASKVEWTCTIINCSIVNSVFTSVLLFLVVTSIYLTYLLIQKQKQNSLQLENLKRIIAGNYILLSLN